MLHRLRDTILLGPPLPTRTMGERTLNKVRALAAFSPDALASIAYANQEIYLGLLVAGSVGLSMPGRSGLRLPACSRSSPCPTFRPSPAIPPAAARAIVAHDNLGNVAGLLAAAALLVDYILDAAVSLTSGVAAITSAFPALVAVPRDACAVLALLITLVNLRGMRETGTLMAVPGLPVPGDLFVHAGLRRPAPLDGPTRWRRCARGRRRSNPAADPAYVFNRLHRADRHRGDQQWRAGLQAAPVEERRADAHRHGDADERCCSRAASG